ncbi:RNA polymerase sigma factor [Diplocloster hominis]|uniref:RNA polymerase sigma factor n=1 Tax=Diplocloster hominis TaxID=3079010 RepID=UPI0031BB7865
MEDNKIIDLFWNRSERAITETREKYERLCMRISMNILHNMQDAEECTNDTYLRLWNVIPQERPVYFSAFLCKITRNLSLGRLKYYMAKKRNMDVLPVYEELEEVLGDCCDLSERISQQELVETINVFLGGLSLEKRNIFIRRYFFFDTVSDIASRYKLTQSKVKSILSRDGKKLRQYLRERGYGDESR